MLGMAHDTAQPEPICFKPAEGREVGLVEAGLNQPGIADRHVDALLNPIGHRRLSPLRDTASAIITDTRERVSVMMSPILSVMSMAQAWVE